MQLGSGQSLVCSQLEIMCSFCIINHNTSSNIKTIAIIILSWSISLICCQFVVMCSFLLMQILLTELKISSS
jgi:hypothetical protein